MINVRTLGLAAAVAAVPLAASAAMINGRLEIAGGLADLQTINLEPNGNLAFDDNTVGVDEAFGDFTSLDGTTVTFNSLNFDPDEVVYVGDSGLTFTAQSYSDFDNTGPEWGFMSNGILQLDGFDDTPGIFAFSTQQTSSGQVNASFSSTTTTDMATPIPLPASVLMLFGALGGLAFLGRRGVA